MKSLLELVWSCGFACGENDSPESKERHSEETRSLMLADKPRPKKKRVWLGSTSGLSPVPMEWKPSLTAISEDKAVIMEERTERVIKRKNNGSSNRSRDKSHSCRCIEDRRDQFNGIPTFYAATPFIV